MYVCQRPGALTASTPLPRVTPALCAPSLVLPATSARALAPQVRTLHEQRADLLYHDERGFNALHHAAAAAHEDLVLYLLQTPHAVELCGHSTGERGTLSNWTAEQVASTDRVRQHIVHFSRGDEDARHRVVQAARKKLHLRRSVGLPTGGGVLGLS